MIKDLGYIHRNNAICKTHCTKPIINISFTNQTLLFCCRVLRCRSWRAMSSRRWLWSTGGNAGGTARCSPWPQSPMPAWAAWEARGASSASIFFALRKKGWKLFGEGPNGGPKLPTTLGLRVSFRQRALKRDNTLCLSRKSSYLVAGKWKQA